MSTSAPEALTAFLGPHVVAKGSRADILPAARRHGAEALLVLDDWTGRVVDLDLRGPTTQAIPAPPARGRPKLGVTAREVTLLPRHWEWLAGQPGGASAALRRLVDQARKDRHDADRNRRTREAVYRVMTTLGGDRPGYEDAIRALFAGDTPRVEELIAAWPADIAEYVTRLIASDGD